MSTNCSVAIENADGSVTGIYGHWDGYIDGVGQELMQNYTTVEEVQGLIALGDCSTIIDNVEAYHRDRGEDWEGVAPRVHDDYSSFIGQMGQEFNYLFKDNVWLVKEAYADTDEFMTVEDALNSQYDDEDEE